METAAVLKNTMPKIPIIMLTFHEDQIKAVPASAFGIKAVVSKADGMSKLIECLHGLFGSRVPPGLRVQWREVLRKRNSRLTAPPVLNEGLHNFDIRLNVRIRSEPASYRTKIRYPVR